jgi:1,4-dihydroxy-2-naphthoate octaprenyltransferase
MNFQAVAAFLRQSRSMFLTCTVVPVAVGGALAWQDSGVFHWGLFLLTLLGVSAAHLGVNLSNDFFDFRFGADRPETAERAYSGGGGSLTRDKLDPERVKLWFWSCFAVALAIGILILSLMEKGKGVVIAIMLLGFFGGYFYTAPPFRFAYRGLGELDIFFFLGPAPVLGTYAVQTGGLTWPAFVCSLPVAGLIAALLWINEYTDFETDKLAGKNNLVVRLGRRNARWGFLALMTFVYAVAIFAVARHYTSAAMLLALLTVPLALRSASRALRSYDDPQIIALAQADYLKVHLFAGLLCAVGIAVGTCL